ISAAYGSLSMLSGFALRCFSLPDAADLRFGPQSRQKLVNRESIDYIRLFDPAPARRRNTVVHHRKAFNRVRVGRDNDFCAALFRKAQVSILQVETLGRGVA